MLTSKTFPIPADGFGNCLPVGVITLGEHILVNPAAEAQPVRVEVRRLTEAEILNHLQSPGTIALLIAAIEREGVVVHEIRLQALLRRRLLLPLLQILDQTDHGTVILNIPATKNKGMNRKDIRKMIQTTETMVRKEKSTVSNSLDETEVPNSLDETEVSNSLDETEVSNSLDETEVPNSLDETKVPNNLDETKVPNSLYLYERRQVQNDPGRGELRIDVKAVAERVQFRLELGTGQCFPRFAEIIEKFLFGMGG